MSDETEKREAMSEERWAYLKPFAAMGAWDSVEACEVAWELDRLRARLAEVEGERDDLRADALLEIERLTRDRDSWKEQLAVVTAEKYGEKSRRQAAERERDAATKRAEEAARILRQAVEHYHSKRKGVNHSWVHDAKAFCRRVLGDP